MSGASEANAQVMTIDQLRAVFEAEVLYVLTHKLPAEHPIVIEEAENDRKPMGGIETVQPASRWL